MKKSFNYLNLDISKLYISLFEGYFMVKSIGELPVRSVRRAIEIDRMFHGVNMEAMPYDDQLRLVHVCYSTLNWVPVEDVSERQLYRVAERLLASSSGIVDQFDHYERAILRNIGTLREMKQGFERDRLNERVCIQIDGLPENSPLLKLFPEDSPVLKVKLN